VNRLDVPLHQVVLVWIPHKGAYHPSPLETLTKKMKELKLVEWTSPHEVHVKKINMGMQGLSFTKLIH
jgi:hypothetical protein